MLHRPVAEAQQAIRQLVGPGPLLTGADDQLRQPSQILDERYAKMDGDGPELPDGQGLSALVGPDEPLQRLQLEAAVGMGHVGPRQSIHARVSGEVARRYLRQKAVVAPREMVADPPELLVHHMEVVEDPLRGGSDLMFRQDRLGDVPVPGQKHVRVVANPAEEGPILRRFPGTAVGRGQALGVLLEALDAEKFGADRVFPLRRIVESGVGGLHLAPPFRHTERDSPSASWDAVTGSVNDTEVQLRHTIHQVMVAVSQVAQAGSAAQVQQAGKILADTRRALYRILAADDQDAEEDSQG